jgi:hypothetical protein
VQDTFGLGNRLVAKEDAGYKRWTTGHGLGRSNLEDGWKMPNTLALQYRKAMRVGFFN